MGQIVSGHFIASTAAVNVAIGFIPDHVRLISALGGTELEFEWYRTLYDDLALAAGKYGFTHSTSGVPGPVATGAAYGIIPYEGDKTPRVRIPAPDGNGMTIASITGDWTTARATAATARSTTAVGTIIRPTTHNGYVYECITAMTTGAATEPTWGTVVGELTIDGTSSLGRWICRIEDITNVGALGFTIGASICTNGSVWVFKAEQHDRYGDFGDHDVRKPVTLL